MLSAMEEFVMRSGKPVAIRAEVKFDVARGSEFVNIDVYIGKTHRNVIVPLADVHEPEA